MSEGRTPSGVVNGRLVGLTDEAGVIPDLVRRLDELTYSLMMAHEGGIRLEHLERGLLTGEARGITWALHLLLPEYTVEEIKWQMMHRYNRRRDGR